eukprot:6247817-Amphidinium_carterae.1
MLIVYVTQQSKWVSRQIVAFRHQAVQGFKPCRTQWSSSDTPLPLAAFMLQFPTLAQAGARQNRSG